MPITVFADVIVPNSVLAAGVRGKQIRKNVRTTAKNGIKQINIDWARTLRQYEFGFVPLSVSQWETIEGMHEVTEGGAYGMLLQDPKDCTTIASEGLLYPYITTALGAIGLGFGVPAHRLYKRYTSAGSARTKDRPITRPSAASATIYRGGTPVTVGASAGNISIDSVTGTITFVADTSQAHTTITVGASTVLNFANGTGIVAALGVGDRVYVSGVTGTAAAALNGLSHTISSKGATSLTVTTSTAGLAVTLAGTGYKYPQASEALTWAGDFYVPVHFASDEIDWELVVAGPAATRMMAGPNVVLMEVRE